MQTQKKGAMNRKDKSIKIIKTIKMFLNAQGSVLDVNTWAEMFLVNLPD